MTVLQIQTTPTGAHDLASTPLGRSLGDQTDNRWKIGTDYAPSPPLVALFIDPDASLHREAVATIIAAFERDPAVLALIADAIVGGRQRRRPGWSPTATLTAPTDLTMLAVRGDLIHETERSAPSGLAGRIWAARQLPTDSQAIVHVPAALSTHPEPPLPDDQARRELDHLALSRGLRVEFDPGPRPGTFRLAATGTSRSISVVIPTAGIRNDEGDRFIDVCIGGLLTSTPSDLEILVVVGDEFADEPDKMSLDPRLRLLHRPSGRFNFSAAVNLGLAEAENELVLVLNDDTEAIDGRWLDQLALHFDDHTVGAVGAALLYPDRTIQHLGVILDDAHPLHPFVGQTLGDVGWHGADVAHDVIAVTGACMMLRRRDALTVGGFSTRLPLSFNDVDLCLKLRRMGRRVIVDPAATLIHHESASRNAEIESWEWNRYIARWGEVVDPWYHPGHRRPDDPDDLRVNADHLDPDVEVFDTRPRDTMLRPKVHHSRG